MKKYFLLFLSVCAVLQTAKAQKPDKLTTPGGRLKSEARLMKGDMSALYNLSNYLDSRKKVTVFLGHHVIPTTVSAIARGLIKENCLFTYNEIGLADTVSRRAFTAFLKRNKKQIVFSPLAHSFLITPLEHRKETIAFRELSVQARLDLEANAGDILRPSWIKEEGIDTLIVQRNPLALVRIASAYYKIRYRFNGYHFNGNEYIRLLQFLTGVETGLGDDTKEISWFPDEGLCNQCKLNLLIYFAKHYRSWQWNNKLSVFANPGIQIRALAVDEADFQLLENENDKVAEEAFARLTEAGPDRVATLAKTYGRTFGSFNSGLPKFPHSFLEQLSLLTAWCRERGIDYKGSGGLWENVSLLRKGLSPAQRRQLEDKLIASLSPEEITAFEYNALRYSRNDALTYSAGRILDIFYSKNWSRILNDKKQLDCYLKKSLLFDRLGIAGVCNSYLQKCLPVQPVDRSRWEHFETEDVDIRKQVRKILKAYNSSDSLLLPQAAGTGYPDEKIEVADLEQRLKQVAAISDANRREDSLVALLERVSYRQVPIAFKAVAPWPYRYPWRKYSFIDNGWFYFRLFDLDKENNREAFLALYNRLTEYQMVEYLTDSMGVGYKTAEGKLDYDTIYDLLKFDIVTAFAGGESGVKNREVYALIKLLELSFSTTLGYPDKLVQARDGRSYSVRERATAWRKYLELHGLLKHAHTGPESFGWNNR